MEIIPVRDLTSMLTPRLQRCLEPGPSVIVASVDAHGAPTCCRAYGLRSTDELETVTVYLPVGTSHETIQALATTGRLTIGASYPADHSTAQFKGVVTDTRLAREDESAFVREQMRVFTDVLAEFGVPKRLSSRLTCWPAFAVTMRVEEIYEQTPGPKAGSRLR